MVELTAESLCRHTVGQPKQLIKLVFVSIKSKSVRSHVHHLGVDCSEVARELQLTVGVVNTAGAVNKPSQVSG